jgi:hypothetical protein
MARPRKDKKILIDAAELASLRLTANRPIETPVVTWEGKRVCLCTPFYKTTNPATAICLGATMGKYGLDKIGWRWKMGDAMVYHSRNYIADRFLETGAEWSFWLDDDIIFPFGNSAVLRSLASVGDKYPDNLLGVDTLPQLLSHGKELVGGLYFGRNDKGKGYFGNAQDPGMHRNLLDPSFTQLLPTYWVATGLLLIHRDVFLKIREACPEIAPGERIAAEDGYPYYIDYWDYFGPLSGRGEDVSFCSRAKKAGIQAYVDTGVRAFHVGYACYNWHNVAKD